MSGPHSEAFGQPEELLAVLARVRAVTLHRLQSWNRWTMSFGLGGHRAGEPVRLRCRPPSAHGRWRTGRPSGRVSWAVERAVQVRRRSSASRCRARP